MERRLHLCRVLNNDQNLSWKKWIIQGDGEERGGKYSWPLLPNIFNLWHMNIFIARCGKWGNNSQLEATS